MSTIDGRVTAVETKDTEQDAAIANKLDKTETAYGAIRDGAGNIIENTYATKEEVSTTVDKIKDVTLSLYSYRANNETSVFVRKMAWTVVDPNLLDGLTATVNIDSIVTGKQLLDYDTTQNVTFFYYRTSSSIQSEDIPLTETDLKQGYKNFSTSGYPRVKDSYGVDLLPTVIVTGGSATFRFSDDTVYNGKL